jgi:hypothetical protein
MLISAAIGAGTGGVTAAATNQDPLKGALMGGLTGAVTGGAMGAFGGGAGAAGADVTAEIGKEIASMQAAGASQAEINAALQSTYGMGQAQANAAVSQMANTGSTAGGIGMQGVSNVGSGIAPAPPPPPSPNAFGYSPLTNTQLGMTAGAVGIPALLAGDQKRYGVPPTEHYTGPLSKFKYDPNTYQPDIVRPPNPAYRPVYAASGGIMGATPPTPGLMDGGQSGNVDYMGGSMYPMSQQNNSHYATPNQMPTSAQQVMASYEPKTNPLTGQMTANMAEGGIASLGHYSDGGRMLKGPGDGMSDSIPGVIGSKQPARLADGEFVVPADVVSHLGNGSTDAGAKQLYSMMNKVRRARTGTQKQGKQINPSKYMPA